MGMTIKQLRSAIRNNVSDGLKGEIPNISYSVEQLQDESFLLRNSLVMKYSMQGKFDFDAMYMTFDSLPIKEIDMSNSHTSIRSGVCKNYILLPRPSPAFDGKGIEYIGDVTKGNSFKVYTNSNFGSHKHKMKISKKPYIYLDMSSRADGNVIGYVYNIDEIKGLRYLSARVIAEDPIKFIETEDCCIDVLDTAFPAPDFIQQEIIDILSKKYIEYYRRMNVPNVVLANKQRDIDG